MKAATNEQGRFLVMCELRSGSRSTFERGLHAAGSILALSDRVWLIRGVGTAGSVRNALVQYIGPRDSLTVVQFEATRTATHNIGPEMDARLRAMLYLDAVEQNLQQSA
jgi:hypothetical protein